METKFKELKKVELSLIANKLFRIGLQGNKANYITTLKRTFANYGNLKYNDMLINMILNDNYIESKEVIKDNSILTIKHALNSYNSFLYKYYLGYKALYLRYKADIKSYMLDASYLFNDQLNTTSGERILIRERMVIPSTGLEEWEYLKSITYKCNYCGNQTKDNSIRYCMKCRGSEELTPEDYHLLKLTRISEGRSKAHKIPSDIITSIIEAQKIIKAKKIKKEIAENKERLVKKINEQKIENNILKFLLDNEELCLLHGLYIYYNHSKTLDFTYKSHSYSDIVNKYKKEIELKFNITVKV